MLLAAIEDGSDVMAFAHAGLKAVWADELNIENPDTLIHLADATGLDYRAAGASPRAGLKVREAELTHEAIGRLVFGAPFYFFTVNRSGARIGLILILIRRSGGQGGRILAKPSEL